MNRPISWSDSFFSVASPEIDLGALLAFEAGAEKELEEDAAAVELRLALQHVRDSLAVVPADVADGHEPVDRDSPIAAHDVDSSKQLSKDAARLAKEYLERYGIARAAVSRRLAAGEPAIDSGRYREFQQKLAEFGEQAAVLARRSGRDRYVMAYAGPDAPGVVAKLTSPLAANQFNIEAATMAVIGNLVMTSIVVSAPRNHRVFGLLKEPASSVSGTDICKRLEAEVAAKFDTFSSHMVRVIPRPGIPEIVWPKPGSSVFHLRARSTDADAVAVVTGEIAERGLALLTFSTWAEPGAHIVDLTLAISPRFLADSNDAEDVLRELQAALERSLGYGSVLVAPADRPTRGAPDPSMQVPERANIISVIGEARPGFVNLVIAGVLRFPAARLKVVGANMAILESFSVLTLIIAPRDVSVADVAWTELETFLQAGVAKRDRVLSPCTVEVTSGRPSRHQPTHELTVEADEQPGVLAKVSDLLSRLSPPVNIVWLSSYVFEPRVGEDRLRCWIQLQLDLSEYRNEEIEELQHQLGWLAAQNRWTCQMLRGIGL